MKHLVLLSILLPLTTSIHSDFTYLDTKGSYHLETTYHGNLASQYPQQSLLPHPAGQSGDQCELYKVSFLQDLYFQYIQYKTEMPKLKEFTLCMWTKFTNHSNDHPLFSYAVDGQPRAIYSWVSNTERSSYYSLSVNGHTFYRLNYPLRLNRWYHSCQSWNGRTGEWQIWVNAERVGRGFHNRLVGFKVPSGGIAITGQEQTQYGGGFQEGAGAPKGSGGMLGEVTMVQLYSVALTAGKAHKDHKHHHAHHFDHNGQPITTPPPPTPAPRPNQPSHPLLTAGQINPALNLNFAQPPPAQIIPGTFSNGQPFNAQLVNGQFAQNLVSQQLLGVPPPASPFAPNFQSLSPRGNAPQTFLGQQLQPIQPQLQPLIQSLQPQIQPQLPPQLPIAQSLQQPFSGSISDPLPLTDYSGSPLSGTNIQSSLINPANVQIIDSTDHQLFKRDDQGTASVDSSTKTHQVVKRDGQVSSAADEITGHKVVKRDDQGHETSVKKEVQKRDVEERTQTKRELVLSGSIFEEGILSYDPSLLSGLATFENNQPVLQQQKESDEREPAEAEVTAVMNLCGGCDPEPFAKALVFGWRTVYKKIYSGAIYAPAVPQCRVF